MNKVTGMKLNENFKEITQDGEMNMNEDMAGNSPIHKYVMFAYNFPRDFIERVWQDEPNIANHLKEKFSGYYSQYGSQGVLNAFYVNLDGENQRKLEDWIINNYNG